MAEFADFTGSVSVHLFREGYTWHASRPDDDHRLTAGHNLDYFRQNPENARAVAERWLATHPDKAFSERSRIIAGVYHSPRRYMFVIGANKGAVDV